MQTIIVYNQDEVTEQKEFQNIKSEDKIWIDLVDPTDDALQNFVPHFHLDQSAVELFTNKSKKPQIRLKTEDHTFTILLDLKYKDSQTVVTEGVYLLYRVVSSQCKYYILIFRSVDDEIMRIN